MEFLIMETDEMWTLLASLMPKEVEVYPDGSEASVRLGNKEVNVIYNDKNNSYTINGVTLNFKDDFEVINTILVPYILQELDGEKRL